MQACYHHAKWNPRPYNAKDTKNGTFTSPLSFCFHLGHAWLLLLTLFCQILSTRSVPAFCNGCTTCIHLPLSLTHTHTAIHLFPNQISVKTIHQSLSFILHTHTSSQNRIILVNIHSINEKSLLVRHSVVQVFALAGWHLYHHPNCCSGVQYSLTDWSPSRGEARFSVPNLNLNLFPLELLGLQHLFLLHGT